MTSADQSAVKLLFVDNEKEILLTLADLLAGENFELLTASSGEEGLEILRNTEGIGVIVSARQMPSMNGIDFLSKVWDLAPDSLRIMLTGDENLDAEHETLYRAGAFRFIAKPWKNEELIKALRDTVSTYTLIRENRRLTALFTTGTREKTERPRQKTIFATH
jgi:DNA-binding NtrC family response regulator